MMNLKDWRPPLLILKKTTRIKMKEYGSDFHICLNEEFLNGLKNPFINKSFSLLFSGRAALYALLKASREKHSWKKVYFPSYYCHEVVNFVKSLDFDVYYYTFNPFLDEENKNIAIRDVSENVIINVSFFGLKKLQLPYYKNASIIEDLTHDILGVPNSKFYFGSLRKVLPLPCGGFFSGDSKIDFSVHHNLKSEALAIKKIAAMHLKREYLNGILEDKNVFRQQFIEAEKLFGENFTNSSLPQSAKVLLESLNIHKIVDAKKKNVKLALAHLKQNDRIVYNMGSFNENALGLILQVNSYKERENLKKLLISKNIYPAILWPNQFQKRDIEIEKRSMFLHIDYRYNSEDILYITTVLNQYFHE
ncbi:MAG TPA: hypothetical protein VFM72_09050 [Aequorivita sp.]|nr:hypothetical protein [Aequorivita sp.]